MDGKPKPITWTPATTRVDERDISASQREVPDQVVLADVRERPQRVLAQFRAAFPDMTVILEEEYADGDLVGTRGRFTGTHKGEFMGIPASGKPIDVKYIDLWRVRDGKLAEHWVQLDMIGLMQQIEGMPGS